MMQSAVPNISTLPTGGERAPSIGRLLVEQGKLSMADIDRVLQLQKNTSLRFGEAALSLGLLTESDVQRALGRQFEYLYTEGGGNQYPPELIAAHQPMAPEVEPLRTIRGQLMLRRLKHGREVFAVIGVSDEDDASHFIANLAILFSQLNERTLIVDANLRRPRQHQIFNLNGTPGLSDVLAGRVDLSAIVKLKHFPNLSILQAGTVPPDPPALLFRPSFSALNTSLAERFDVVLYDVSAFSTSADALAVAACAGGVMLVASRHHTRVADISVLGEQIEQAGAKLVGSILIDY